MKQTICVSLASQLDIMSISGLNCQQQKWVRLTMTSIVIFWEHIYVPSFQFYWKLVFPVFYSPNNCFLVIVLLALEIQNG